MLSKEQKIEAYTACRDRFQFLVDNEYSGKKVYGDRLDENNAPFYGMCFFLRHWLSDRGLGPNVNFAFPELLSSESEVTYNPKGKMYWFHLTKLGDIKRIELLNKVIKTLNS